jgi:multidrug efflux system outer membrane protein
LHTLNNTSLWLVVIGIALLTGCALFKPPHRQNLTETLPSHYSLYSTTYTQDRSGGWHYFKNSELDRLINKAMSQNFSIRQAKARLDQARAVSMQAGAASLPQLDFKAEATAEPYKSGSMGERSTEEYGLGFLAGYEVDLWGRISSQQQAARLDQSAVKEDLYTAGITLAGEVTQHWIDIIVQRMELKILAKQLKTNQTLQELVDLRFRKGMVSALDVYQQKQTVSEVKASLPLVQLAEILLKHQLAYLLGQPPTSKLNIQTQDLPEITELPPIGIPADLLANRPDVRAAGLRLKSADWVVAAAKADRLPALSLNARATYLSNDFGSLFDNWILNLMGSLTGPIFDGHHRKAEISRTRALVQERVADYSQVVYLAIKEVEDQLVQAEKHREHLTALRDQLTVAQNALREANERYQRGLSDYLPVLTQLLATQRLERDILHMRRQLISDRIGLLRSLGGCLPKKLLLSYSSRN